MRILLAEDEKELSNALVAILKHNNYSIDAVYDGEIRVTTESVTIDGITSGSNSIATLSSSFLLHDNNDKNTTTAIKTVIVYLFCAMLYSFFKILNL